MGTSTAILRRFLLVAAVLCGCVSCTGNNNGSGAENSSDSRGDGSGGSRSDAHPAQKAKALAEKPATKPVVAIIGRCLPSNTPAQQQYVRSAADVLRRALEKDSTVTVLPQSTSDSAVEGLTVTGLVSSGAELKQAVGRLPAECNVVLVPGPFPPDAGWFSISIARPRDLKGMAFNYGPVKPDEDPAKSVSIEMIRGDIDALLGSQ